MNFSEYHKTVYKSFEFSLRVLCLFALGAESYESMVLLLIGSAHHGRFIYHNMLSDPCYVNEQKVLTNATGMYLYNTKRNCTFLESFTYTLRGAEHEVLNEQLFYVSPEIIIFLRFVFWCVVIWITVMFYMKQSGTEANLIELTTPPLDKFHEACKKGNKEGIRKLFYKHQSEIQINDPLPNGNTVLHEAIITRNHGTAKALLKYCHHHLDFDILSAEGFRYIDSCILYSDLDMIRILMKHIKPCDTHLHQAISEGNVKVTKELMAKLSIPDSPRLQITFWRFSQTPSDLKIRQSLKNCINGIDETDVHVIYSCNQCYFDMFESECKIFACKSDHYICEECQTKPIKICVWCKEEFSKRNGPKRRIASERIRNDMKCKKLK